MQTFDVYEDIARRTGGDIYIGVVGPVRTGKSTLIGKLLSELILPYLPPSSFKDRSEDEMPQSSDGKTVMTTEPKFVPGEAVKVKISDAEVNLRLVDCVGFAVEGASGFEEDGKPRYIKTPWSESPLPFSKAAEIGTEKVIREHSTIGILVTTDGSFTGIERASYEKAEEKTVGALKEIGKPFVIVLNTAEKNEPLREALEEKYKTPVLNIDILHLNKAELEEILQAVLFEFPLLRADIALPAWMEVLSPESKIIGGVLSSLREVSANIEKIKDAPLLESVFKEESVWKGTTLSLFPAEGRIECRAEAQDGVFYGVLSEECGREIKDESELMEYVKVLSESKKKFDLVGSAFEDAEESGYGVIYPEDLSVGEPKLIKSGPHFGAKIRATASGYHIVKVDVTGEVSQILGTQQQGEAFVEELKSAYGSEEGILHKNVFGRSVESLLTEELDRKMNGMSAEAKRKMKRTLSKIVNEGKNNLICFVF
ncbi:MAG: stage IV sporulation protein A [Clostridia bacterium]|nr:stage IV sporulation protein A [Clostridia bacterium]